MTLYTCNKYYNICMCDLRSWNLCCHDDRNKYSWTKSSLTRLFQTTYKEGETVCNTVVQYNVRE